MTEPTIEQLQLKILHLEQELSRKPRGRVMGEPLDVQEHTHSSYRQDVSVMFNWHKLYSYWPWGYIDKEGERRKPVHDSLK